MLGKNNSIHEDFEYFLKNNNFKVGSDWMMQYATLAETRLQNNLTLLSNPTLCAQYGINVEDLYAELDSLMEIRQKISFSDRQNKKTR